MTPTSAIYRPGPPDSISPPSVSCPCPPLHLTASTAIASLLAGATTTVLAYASGLDPSVALLTGIAAFALGSVFWLAENFSLMRQQQFMHATLQHVLFNGTHVAVSGLLGTLPASLAAQQLASRFGSVSAPAGNAAPSTGAAPQPEISAGGFALLLAAVALPTFVVYHFFARTLACSRETRTDDDAAQASTAAPAQNSAAGCALRRISDVAAPLVATAALLAAPAYAIHHFAGSDQGVRFLVLCMGNVGGSMLRQILNQTTARAWTSIRRTGISAGYGLSQEPPLQRGWSTLVSTSASIALFAASSAMFQLLTELFPDLQLAPAGMSILSLSAAEFARRVCMRQLALSAPGEMLEALWRYLPLGAYAALSKIPLEYRRARGCGLLHSARQWMRHVTDTASYQKAVAFAGPRVADGSVVTALQLLPYCHWAAPLVQGCTMARTPILAANVLPKLDLARERSLDIIEAGQEDEDSSIAAAGSQQTSDCADSRGQSGALECIRDFNTSSYVHSYF
jgi:hypothetical protein